MKTYNKVMLYFWLFVSALLFIVVTYMGFSEGFKKWSFYYLFAFLALFAFISRRWMMKRMEKHTEYMKQQEQESAEK